MATADRSRCQWAMRRLADPATIGGELERPRLEPGGPEVERVTEAIRETLERRDPAARRRAAGRVLRAYEALPDGNREQFFELLVTRFGIDDVRLADALESVRCAAGASRDASIRVLRRVLTPRYTELFDVIAGLPAGVRRIVDLRADLLALGSRDPALGTLDDELARHLGSVFNVGALELRRITWESASAALLERLMAYEAVHAIDGWDDLKHRLENDHQCFAFLHPAMPDDPLAFVQIALTHHMADDLSGLLDIDAPQTDAAAADTAMLYSITNGQPGLAGINLGNELIKRVIAELDRELPQLQTYATLSPMPNFRQWAQAQLDADAITPGERDAFDREAADVVIILADDSWTLDPGLVEHFRSGLLSMAARYITTGQNGRALDGVAHFHLSNGAAVERVNWLAHRAPYEMRRSFGLMVNYTYAPEHLEANVEQYRAEGIISVSGQVSSLIR